ncbi:hypothetical protein BHOIPH791_09710 [Bartonella henselae]|nr:hypothetical protein O97_00144 [Bartonella henselae str. Zeus]KEC60923.1 hypothetical protein O95_00318 [Bartonella henselae JK 53]CDO40837.1 ribosomal-protein-alanine acetyltransferase [Bartonella henselae]CUH91411.1 ribosomal-protein-alanine acetyltransferase [Bartonella henselae]GFF02119.1 hypothetical protein BH623125_05530 [Bartonella henselae]
MIAITKKRTISTLIGLEDAGELSSYSLHNANPLCPWEPIKSDDQNTLLEQHESTLLLVKMHKEQHTDMPYD